MKREPLKGKVMEFRPGRITKDFDVVAVYDIRSAVKWLKQDLHESFMMAKEIQGDITDKQLSETLKLINKAIDQAFEDVVKEKPK